VLSIVIKVWEERMEMVMVSRFLGTRDYEFLSFWKSVLRTGNEE